jgi:hypothetical protein
MAQFRHRMQEALLFPPCFSFKCLPHAGSFSSPTATANIWWHIQDQAVGDMSSSWSHPAVSVARYRQLENSFCVCSWKLFVYWQISAHVRILKTYIEFIPYFPVMVNFWLVYIYVMEYTCTDELKSWETV